VLYASVVEGKRVEPHYIIDTVRSSSLRELQAIDEVKASLKASYPGAYERIDSLHITSKHEIPEDAEITQAWARLRQRSHLGSQYDWLARYTHSKNLTDLELCVHVDDKLYGFIRDHVEQNPSGSYRVKTTLAGDERIFTRFEFPILDYSKTRMRDLAIAHGFLPILEKSWFCYEPRAGRPCGMCNPCVYSIEEGMSYRFSQEAMFRYRTRRYRRAIADVITAARRVYRFVRGGSSR
jgi:hypothetical protein